MLKRALDVESLNIKIGKFCWEVTIELTLINNDGNFLDAMNYAALACLLRFKHNFVIAENNDLRVYPSKEKAKKVFSLNHLPFLFTFSILNENKSVSDETEDYVIFDPTVA